MVILRKLDLFAGLTDVELKKIYDTVQEKKVRKGEYIFLRGTFGKVLYIIEDGLVRIEQPTERGRSKTLSLLGPGECFGEMAVVTNMPRSASAQAVDDCTLLVLKRASFLELLVNRPKMSLRIIEVLCQRLTDANEQIKSLTFSSVPARLANHLLSLAEKFGEQTGKGQWRIRIRLTHQELADIAGSTREIITRTLKTFADDGSVYVDAERHIHITDAEKLAQWIN